MCGATSYGNLRAWARGKACNFFYYVPPKAGEGEGGEGGEAEGGKKGTQVGVLGRAGKKYRQLKKDTVEKGREEWERRKKGVDKAREEEAVEAE